MPPKLLLTGASGFIGYYLTRALAARAQPFIALVRPDSDMRYLSELDTYCTLVEGDLNDPESLYDALDGVETVIHAAAVVSYRSSDKDLMLKVNAEGTANLVNMMLQRGARRLIYISSVAALHRVDGGGMVSLSDRWPMKEPNTPYARSKFAAEREVWRGQAEGLSVAAAYPATVLGAGDWTSSNTPALWRRASEGGRIYPLGSAGFVDVRDVSRAVISLLDRDLDRDRFLLVAENLAWQTVLAKIALSIGAAPPTYGMPAWQSALLWPVEALRAKFADSKPLVTRATHHNLQSVFTYDGSRYPLETGNAYLPLDATIAEIGKAFLLSRSLGAPFQPTYLPLL